MLVGSHNFLTLLKQPLNFLQIILIVITLFMLILFSLIFNGMIVLFELYFVLKLVQLQIGPSNVRFRNPIAQNLRALAGNIIALEEDHLAPF